MLAQLSVTTATLARLSSSRWMKRRHAASTQLCHNGRSWVWPHQRVQDKAASRRECGARSSDRERVTGAPNPPSRRIGLRAPDRNGAEPVRQGPFALDRRLCAAEVWR